MPLSHPFRLAGDRVAVLEENTPRVAAELAGAVLATTQGERGLAPNYGIPDPAGSTIDESELAGWVEINEPELEVTEVELSTTTGGVVGVKVTVNWVGRD